MAIGPCSVGACMLRTCMTGKWATVIASLSGLLSLLPMGQGC
jgi:hypothetical protein